MDKEFEGEVRRVGKKKPSAKDKPNPKDTKKEAPGEGKEPAPLKTVKGTPIIEKPRG